MSILSFLMRTKFKKADAERNEGQTTPEDIIRFVNIPYGRDPKWHILDVYRPKSAEGKKLPVIVNVHGGGWVYGSKEGFQYYCMSLAQRGFAVVNYNYRLAPEHKFPDCFEDTNNAFKWVLSHGEEYGFDLGHVFAVGDSAGGHILGMYANFCTNPEYAKKYSMEPPKGFAPTAIALNCGAYKFDAPGFEGNLMKILPILLPKKWKKEDIDWITVPTYVTEKFPPSYIMTATGDFLKEQAPLMVKKLEEYNIPYVYKVYGNKDKNLLHVFHCDLRLAEAKECNDDECDFFKRFV